MIDFHCHVDLYSDPAAVVEGIVARGCYVLAVTTTPLAWEGTRRLIGDAPRVRVAVGLHPELVANRHLEAARLCALVAESRYVGEIGLDGSSRHYASLDLQVDVLQQVLAACQHAGGRIMTVHSRGAAGLVLDQFERFPGAGIPVLHWFSGTQSELSRAIEAGCWFSVGPVMLESSKGRRLVAKMPQDRVITETDGPFTRSDLGPLMPWDVESAEVALASLWGCTVESARQRLHDNLRRLAADGALTQAGGRKGG